MCETLNNQLDLFTCYLSAFYAASRITTVFFSKTAMPMRVDSMMMKALKIGLTPLRGWKQYPNSLPYPSVSKELIIQSEIEVHADEFSLFSHFEKPR